MRLFSSFLVLPDRLLPAACQFMAACSLSLAAGSFTGCNRATHNPEDDVKYTGPRVEAHDILTLYSDSAKLKMRLTAPVQQEFENGDAIFPKGLKVLFFENSVEPTTTLTANYGKLEKRTDVYVVRDNVQVENTRKKETLKTEELYWDKRKKQVHTTKFVRIETPTEVLTGQGLTANQDFSRYRILKPSGVFSVQP